MPNFSVFIDQRQLYSKRSESKVFESEPLNQGFSITASESEFLNKSF